MAQKIRIIKSEYWADLDTILWHIEFVKDENRKFSKARIKAEPEDKILETKQLVFRTQDLKDLLGITQKVTDEQWNNFCEEIKGKTKFIDMQAYNGIADDQLDQLKAHRKDIKEKIKQATLGKDIDEGSIEGFKAEEVQKLSEVWHTYPFYEAKAIEDARKAKEGRRKK